MDYFNLYKKYYDSLMNQESMVENANSLVSLCENSLRQINSTYFDKISNSKWEELGKVVVRNNILVTLKSNITKTVEFINNNLKVACDLSIGSLLPTVIEIKTADETLQGLKCKLSEANNDRSTVESKLASTSHYIVDANGNKKINSIWSALKGQLDLINQNIGQLQTDIGNQIEKLKMLCREANSTISSILALDGSLSVNKANLPDYASIPIPDYASIEDLSNELAEPITFEKILADSKFPFKIIEDSYIETDDRGYRFEFKYENKDNGVTEKGFILVPGNANKKYEHIFAFYSGSGGLDWNGVNRFFHGIKANPKFPIIVFSRFGRKQEYRSLEEMNTTLEAIKDFSSYFGTSEAKVHAIGNSRGGQELNVIVAENPKFFSSATIINGSIKFDVNEARNSEKNWVKRLYNPDDVKKKCNDLISNYENTPTQINIFVGTADSNITPKEQLEDYCKIFDMTTDYHYLPLGERVDGFVYNREGKQTERYRPIMFNELADKNYDSIKSMFPKLFGNISDDFKGDPSKQANDTSGKMDLYLIDGGEHANSTLFELLGRQEFYDLIINTLE